MQMHQAAVEALRIIGRRVKVEDIQAVIEEHKLYYSRGQTPTQTLRVMIRKRLLDFTHGSQDRTPKVFYENKPEATYGLVEWLSDVPEPETQDTSPAVSVPPDTSFLENYGQWIPEQVFEPELYVEGATKTISVTSYERDAKAREACIAHWGTSCQVCGFSFEKRYGELGRQFIYVHHLRPLSEVDEGYQVDPVEDMRPVCGNCHAMLHKRKLPLAIEELQEVMDQVHG